MARLCTLSSPLGDALLFSRMQVAERMSSLFVIQLETCSLINQCYTRGPLVAAHPAMKPLMRYARTATLRTALPYTDPAAAIKARRIAWYEHLEGKGIPTIAVVHGDDVIATTADGLTFEQVADRFREWIEEGATATPAIG